MSYAAARCHSSDLLAPGFAQVERNYRKYAQSLSKLTL